MSADPKPVLPDATQNWIESILTQAGFGGRQSAPNHANAPQSAPRKPFLQIEPTAPQLLSTPRLNAPHSAPNHANAPRANENCRTNPPPRPQSAIRPSRPLTPNQLRAARLLVAGHSTNAIAAALSVDRHTIADWKRLPLFQQELRALLDRPTTTP